MTDTPDPHAIPTAEYRITNEKAGEIHTPGVLPEMQAEARGYARGLRDAAVICNKVRGMSVCVRDAEQTDQAHDLAVDRCQEYILARIPTDTPNQTKPPEAEI